MYGMFDSIQINDRREFLPSLFRLSNFMILVS